MEAISKPILNRLAIELPTNVCHLLRCGEFTVYDLLELIVNSVSKVVKSTDGNSKAMEDFALRIAEWSNLTDEALEEWKQQTYNILLGVAQGNDEPVRFVINDGEIVWKYLSDDIKEKIEANHLNDGDVTWRLLSEEVQNRITEKSEGTEIISIYVDKNGDIVVETGDEEEPEIRTAGGLAFAKDRFDGKIIGEMVTEPEDGIPYDEKGGMMSAQDYIDLQKLKNKQHNMPGNASKTALGLVKVGSNIDVTEGGVISTKLSNFGLSFDTEKGTMTYDGKTYKLTAVEDVVTEIVEYDAPVVTSIVYNGYLSNNGYGSKAFVPTVTFSQKKVTHYSDNSEDKVEWLNGDLNTDGATFHFTINKTTEGSEVNVAVNSETGEVTAGGSVWLENKKLGDVYATVEYNGKAGTLTSASGAVTQQKAVFTLSPESMSVGSEATNGKRITITKSSGVSIGTIQSSNTQVVTPNGIENNQIKLVIAENTGEQRSATITVNTNNANIPSKSVTIAQAAGTAGTMMAYGMCKTDADADLIAAITAADKTKLNETDDYSATVESTMSDAVKVHYVALTNGSTYGVKAFSEANESEYPTTSILTKTLTVDGAEMKVYYISQKMILDKTTFKIYK